MIDNLNFIREKDIYIYVYEREIKKERERQRDGGREILSM